MAQGAGREETIVKEIASHVGILSAR
jgi:hypothetical protein